MNIPVINKSHHPLPAYQTEHAAAMDAAAFLPDGSVTLQPLERVIISTGLFFAIPQGCEMQVRSRSGLSFKHGIMCINSPGTIDADYRGELKLLMANLSNEAYTVHDGDRLAQLVVAKCEHVEWKAVETLDKTARGEGGVGHTGR